MRIQGVLVGSLIVGAVGLLAADDARACSPCQDFTQVFRGSFRTAPLPASTRLFIPGTGLDHASIVVTGTLAGAVVDVPFAVVAGDDALGSAFVDIDWAFVDEGEVVVATNVATHTYPIGARVDEQAPATPTVAVKAGAKAACCETVSVSLTATDVTDDDLPQLLKVVLSSSAGERVAYFGDTTSAAVLGSSTGGCLESDPLAVDGEAITASVSVIDWAGNESAPVPVAFTYGTNQAASCGDPGDGPFGCTQGSGLPWAASLVVLALRRRRRQQA